MLRSTCNPLPFVLGFVLLLASLESTGSSDDGVADLLVAGEIPQLIQSRSYAAALDAIDVALANEDAAKDVLTYLKGRVLCHQEKYDEAVAVLAQFSEQHPESAWGHRAGWASGVAPARKGDYRSAVKVYRQHAERLLSDKRRQELAGILVRLAEAFYEPEDSEVEPDYQAAMEYFTQALTLGAEPPDRIKMELRIARCHQELQKYDKAVGRYEAFIEQHSVAAQVVEARFQLGVCLMAQEKLQKARIAWQDLLEIHAASTSARIAEAAFELSRTWGIPEPASTEQLDLGVAVLERFLDRFPEHEKAAQAQLDIAGSYLHLDRSEDAAKRLRSLLDHPRHETFPEISQARNLLGLAYFAQEKYVEAIAVWRDFLTRHPADPLWAQVQRDLVNAEYRRGLQSYQSNDLAAARQTLAEFMAKFPLDERNPGILFLLGQMLHQEKKWDEAIEHWRRVVSKYPQTDEASHAQFKIAQTLEQDLAQLDKAIEEYRKLKRGEYVDDAQSAVARLTDKSLKVLTERVFRSNETPVIRLTTRNIPSVSVRVYPINMEAYFRKMLIAEAVEHLDIALIDPERSFEVEIPAYAAHRELESPVDVPLPNATHAGAMAVTVTSDTLEATTLVLQSDLDIIVKSSRDELFVFAENMRTSKPAPGVRVLVADGERVLDVAVTDENGVLQKDFDWLRDATDVRVLALDGRHVASNVVDLNGIGVAQGLKDRGYIYSDRPVYRSGDRVFVRGCIRHAEDDRYGFVSGEEFVLEVYDSADRIVWRQPTQLGEFGCFSAEYPLPDATRPGTYRIQVQDAKGRNFQGTFLVNEYKLEPVRLVVESPQWVYYRGEEIVGTIRAEYNYGAPVVRRDVAYQLADGRSYSATTDDKGEVHFKIPTRDFLESQPLPLKVVLPEWNLQTAVNFMLATQAFSIDISTVRDAFLVEEPFEVTIAAHSARGEPGGRDLQLAVLEVTRQHGAIGERLVEEDTMPTSGDDGVARKTLKIDQAGRYRLRASGKDRYGNHVTAETELYISGDKDRVRLRILADKRTFKVGEEAKIRILWREEAALALVTFEGSRILDHQLVPLTKGVNRLPLAMTLDLAPNFDLAVSVMTDHGRAADADKAGAKTPAIRFHEAVTPFSVDRELKVTLTIDDQQSDRMSARPGEPVTLTLRTADQQGHPVSAEFSLALVERSLLEQFPSPLQLIHDFFRGVRRESAMRTTSSIEFSYQPETRPIDPLLLTEKQRAEWAEQEAASWQREVETRKREFASGMGGMGGMGGVFGGTPAGGAALETDHGSPAFAELLELIKEVPEPDLLPAAWETDDDGLVDPFTNEGLAELDPFPGHLSLVVSQEQTVQTVDVVAQGLRDRLLEATAYWNPSVVTGADGIARVTIPIPEKSATWSCIAKGITADTLAGERTVEIVTKSPLFGQLKLPGAFTLGDTAEIHAVVHHHAITQGTIKVTLETQIGSVRKSETKEVHIEAAGVSEIPFGVSLAGDDLPEADALADSEVRLQLSVAVGEHHDVQRRAVPLRPYGVNVLAAEGGSSDADAVVWVQSPPAMRLRSPRLQVLVGPTIERSLLDVVSGGPIPTHDFWTDVEPAAERNSTDLMAALALQHMLQFAPDSDSVHARALDAHIRAAIGSLVSAQEDAGGWRWTDAAKQSDRYLSARALWSWSLARRAGYQIPNASFDKAQQFLEQQIAEVDNNDYESKAILLHALTVAGRRDFSLANRLYRERSSLSIAALVHTALSLIEMDRPQSSSELLNLAKGRGLGQEKPSGDTAASLLAWNCSATERRALYLLALLAEERSPPEAKTHVDWLLANRSGVRWMPGKATGPAMLALCRWFATKRSGADTYRVTVSVNDQPVQTLEMDPASLTQIVDVPGTALAEGRQKVQFRLEGRGRYAFHALLEGFVPADELKGTVPDWQVQRTYTPAPLQRNGRDIQRGFANVLDQDKRFLNPLTQLPVGRTGIVELKFTQRISTQTPLERRDYIVVREPIPSGAAVIPQSVTGTFERYDIEPGAITFYVGNRFPSGRISYQVVGYLPGRYRAAPTVMRSVYRPERIAVASPKSLQVLRAGTNSADPYRLSPAELYELGSLAVKNDELQQAEEYFSSLLGEWKLKPDAYRHVVGELLQLHLKLQNSDEIVRYFEVIRERWPERQISFDDVLKIGSAYEDLGEFERSYLVLRNTTERCFTVDSGIPGFLAYREEFLSSVQVMERLLREYPPEPYVATAHFSLAEQLSAKAPEARNDAQLVKANVNRVDLILRALRMLNSFLVDYPNDPAADQVAFAAANALLDIDKQQETAAACRIFADRYPRSKLLDSFWYITGYCEYEAGQHDSARDVLQKVVDYKSIDPANGPGKDSPNKWPAAYILGQIHHSLDQTDRAIEWYRRVEDRYPDAKKSIEYFLRKSMRLPEVTTIRPGNDVQLKLAYRNIETCELQVYRIDLMKFALLRRNLDGIAEINLAGIEPLLEKTVELAGGRPYRENEQTLAVDVQEEGAYLVVCRGGSVFASGFLLVTPLEVELQHDTLAGEARATVKDVVQDHYLHDVHVKIIGSGNAEFVSGETDRRGLFIAEGIAGSATVIAQAESGRYAFYRADSIAAMPNLNLHALRAAARLPRPFGGAGPARGGASGPFGRTGVVVSGPGDGKFEQQIEAALETPTVLTLENTRLSDLALILQQQHRIPVRIDKQALEDYGIDTATPVTFQGNGLSLRSALSVILRELDLTFVIEDEFLTITTPEEAECRLTTVVYPVADLVQFQTPEGEKMSDFDTLVDLIQSTIAPDSWDEVGGPGAVDSMQYGDADVIVLSQTQDVHWQIEGLLQRLRTVPGATTKDGALPVRSVTPNDPFSDQGGRGGYGGFGGGMGGGGGAMGGLGGDRVRAIGPAASPTNAMRANLLRGLQDQRKKMRGRQVDKLEEMYGEGMGGFGGGINAGGAF